MPKTKRYSSKKKMTVASLPPELADIAARRRHLDRISYGLQKFEEQLYKGKDSLCRAREMLDIIQANDKMFPHTPAITSSIPKLPIVTPKVPVNTPFSVTRVPQQGEVPLSLSGSPVMVSTMSHETKANINIPLGGAMIASLVPEAGLDPTCLPVLDEEMVEPLETLNEHTCAFINKATKK